MDLAYVFGNPTQKKVKKESKRSSKSIKKESKRSPIAKVKKSSKLKQKGNPMRKKRKSRGKVSKKAKSLKRKVVFSRRRLKKRKNPRLEVFESGTKIQSIPFQSKKASQLRMTEIRPLINELKKAKADLKSVVSSGKNIGLQKTLEARVKRLDASVKSIMNRVREENAVRRGIKRVKTAWKAERQKGRKIKMRVVRDKDDYEFKKGASERRLKKVIKEAKKLSGEKEVMAKKKKSKKKSKKKAAKRSKRGAAKAAKRTKQKAAKAAKRTKQKAAKAAKRAKQKATKAAKRAKQKAARRVKKTKLASRAQRFYKRVMKAKKGSKVTLSRGKKRSRRILKVTNPLFGGKMKINLKSVTGHENVKEIGSVTVGAFAAELVERLALTNPTMAGWIKKFPINGVVPIGIGILANLLGDIGKSKAAKMAGDLGKGLFLVGIVRAATGVAKDYVAPAVGLSGVEFHPSMSGVKFLPSMSGVDVRASGSADFDSLGAVPKGLGKQPDFGYRPDLYAPEADFGSVPEGLGMGADLDEESEDELM